MEAGEPSSENSMSSNVLKVMAKREWSLPCYIRADWVADRKAVYFRTGGDVNCNYILRTAEINCNYNLRTSEVNCT